MHAKNYLQALSLYVEVNNIKPNEVSNLMINSEVKIYLFFLNYILKIINILNTEFQSEQIRLPYLYVRLESTIKKILKNFVAQTFLKKFGIKKFYNK